MQTWPAGILLEENRCQRLVAAVRVAARAKPLWTSPSIQIGRFLGWDLGIRVTPAVEDPDQIAMFPFGYYYNSTADELFS
jgi:hypothetical protein